MGSLLDKFFLEEAPASSTGTATPRTIVEALGGGSRNVESFSVSGKEVGQSRDLARVLELPRRARPDAATLDRFRAELSYLQKLNLKCECRSKFGRKCADRLNDTQAWGAHEIAEQGGLLGPISVGDGKTLLDLLAAMLVKDCKVAVLFIPPQLRDQMRLVDWAFYGQHWNLPNLGDGTWFDAKKPTLHIISYSALSGAKNSDVLERTKPDLIIADEAQFLRNATAARTKRFNRYMRAHPETRFCCWSGTLTTKSIKDYAHLSEFALREGSPAPLHWPTVEEWSGAIDPSDWPTGIGALSALCDPGEHVRDGYRRRLESTGGVVSSPATMSCSASLVFSERHTVAPKAVMEAIHALAMTWTRPDGEELITGLDVHRCAKELSAGFYYHWVWPRGETEDVKARWLNVRKEWHREMREKLKQSREFMDSPLLLVRAAIRWHEGYEHIRRDDNGKEQGRELIPPHSTRSPQPTWDSACWPEWREVRDTAKPETEGVWIDDWLARDCAAWCRENVGICWYEHDLFGKRVAQLADAPLFGAGPEARAALLGERGTRSIVASIRSHGTGKNLQMFSRNLLGNQFSDAATGEQLLGRTHRQGQEADTVTVEVYLHTPIVIDALARARNLAQYIQDTMGGSQKLLRATYNFGEIGAGSQVLDDALQELPAFPEVIARKT